jgi:hypothetical protein
MAMVLLGLMTSARSDTSTMNSELGLKKDIDLGVILDTTQPLDLTIPVKNLANRKLTITKVSKDCSCTSVSIDKNVLLPGETAYLHVVTNLTGKTNLYTGSIIIQSDSVEQMDEILIHGQITGQIRIRPQRTTLLTGDESAPGNFTVFCDDQDGEWKYLGFSSDDPDLVVTLNQKSTSPTTSIYEGLATLNHQASAKSQTDYHVSLITFKFANDKLGKNLELKYPIDIAVRRKISTDPSKVIFLHDATEQKRSVLIQSKDPIFIDAADCNSPAVKAALLRIDNKTVIIELISVPKAIQGATTPDFTCDLRSKGKILTSIPISFVNIP